MDTLTDIEAETLKQLGANGPVIVLTDDVKEALSGLQKKGYCDVLWQRPTRKGYLMLADWVDNDAARCGRG